MPRRRAGGTIVFKAEHARIAAIFTLDAGGGRTRGVSVCTQALAAIFEPWVAPCGISAMMMVRGATGSRERKAVLMNGAGDAAKAPACAQIDFNAVNGST